MSIYQILKDMCVALKTLLYPSGRSDLTKLKWDIFKSQLHRSQVSEYKAIKHFNDEVNICCNGRDAPGGYKHFFVLYLYNPYW